MSVLRMSTRGGMTGIMVSSLWMVAAVVALLGLLLRLLTVERAELGAVLGHLVQQELTLVSQQCRVCICGRREVGKRIVPGGERRAQPSCSARRSLRR